MAKTKTLTEQALIKRREAYTERREKPVAAFAPRLEKEAEELLNLPLAPDVGPGGEVVREQTPNATIKRSYIRETLAEGTSRIAEDASIQRADLLLQPSFNAVAMGIDAAASIGAKNSLEKMLAHQAAIAHDLSMRFADRALSYEHSQSGDQVEACRCANTAARLMGAFQGAMQTLQKLRTGGTQTVTVQHVNVQSGAQAVIGNVQSGQKAGEKDEGENNGKPD